MADIAAVTVNVNVGINIDKRTAETCLHLVQMYVNSHDGVCVAADWKPNGEVVYTLEEHHE